MDYFLISILLGLLDSHNVFCLIVTDINVPRIVDFRENVTLSCSYDMKGHTLNSVKWYKDSLEFFRYSPLTPPVYMAFPVSGVQLTDNKNHCNESICRVELTLLNVKSSGTYICEVSDDAPHFKLTAKSSKMTVEALPQNNPLINNFHPMYRFNDFVRANCTTDFSSLPAKLTWFINGVEASHIDVQPVAETTIPGAHEYNLHRQALQLNFYANDPRFHRSSYGDKSRSGTHAVSDRIYSEVIGKTERILELRCLAEIENFPELRRETSLSAVLIYDVELLNQKLVNSGKTVVPHCLAIILQQVFTLVLMNYRSAYHVKIWKAFNLLNWKSENR